MSTPRKRFIAGAVCPACQALDRLVLFKENERQIYECVACGYREIEGFDGKETKPGESAPAEPLKFFPDRPKR